MKKIILLFIVGFFTIKINAQQYQSVISRKSLWTSIDCFVLSSIEYKGVRKEMMYGDTIIAGLNYKKMYRDTSATFNWLSAEYLCAIRESNKIVYYVPNDGSGEKILYDYNKTVGDSVEVIGYGLNYPSAIKLKIDSVFITNINGVNRKTYKFNANGSYHTDEYWYEGIGSSFGFLTPFNSVSDNIFTLKCNSKNDTLFFLLDNIGNFLCSPNEPSNNCEYAHIPTSVNEIKNSTYFDFFPNPVEDEFNIACSEKINNIQLYSLEGKSENYTLTNSIINIHELSSGIYFLVIETEKGKLTKKLIKL